MSHSASMRSVVFAALILTAGSAGAQLKDKPQCAGKEHPLFTRMPNWYLYSCDERQFAQYRFPVLDGNKKRSDQTVEGHFYQYYFRFDASAGPAPSGLQIGRNYANAAVSAGGEVLYSDNSGRTTMRFNRDGNQTWGAAWYGGSGLNLVVLEVEAMKQEVTANAEALKGGLATNGHVELKGILFDTGKSELKPESESALAEVEKLLKAQPELAMWVVGHTDSVGGADANLALSQGRAAAVVKALVEQRGIDAARLASFGAGPFAPIATNATEEGRARNRRVELVAR